MKYQHFSLSGVFLIARIAGILKQDLYATPHLAFLFIGLTACLWYFIATSMESGHLIWWEFLKVCPFSLNFSHILEKTLTPPFRSYILKDPIVS